jgi:hypothetical protein
VRKIRHSVNMAIDFLASNTLVLGMGINGCGAVMRVITRRDVQEDIPDTFPEVEPLEDDERVPLPCPAGVEAFVTLVPPNLIAEAYLNERIGEMLIMAEGIEEVDDIRLDRTQIAREVTALEAEVAEAEVARLLDHHHIPRFGYDDFRVLLGFVGGRIPHIPATFRHTNREEMAALRDRANEVLANIEIPLVRRRDLRGNLRVRGLEGHLRNPVRAAVLYNVGIGMNVRLGQENGARIMAHFARWAHPELERIIREEVEIARGDGQEIPIWARAVVDGATERINREEYVARLAEERRREEVDRHRSLMFWLGNFLFGR